MAAHANSLLSLQSLLHVSSYAQNGAVSKKKETKSSGEGKQKETKDNEKVDLSIEGVAIEPKNEVLSAADTNELVALARMFSEEGNFLGTCLHVDQDQFSEQETSTTNIKTLQHDTIDEEASGSLDSLTFPLLKPPSQIPLERLKQAHVFPLLEEIGEATNLFETSIISGVIESGLLVGDLDKAATSNLIDINSGGELYFIFFRNQSYFNGEIERACVIKFAPNRMSTQGEALAYEIAASVGAPSPSGRIIRENSHIWEILSNGIKTLVDQNQNQNNNNNNENEKEEPRGVGDEKDAINTTMMTSESLGSESTETIEPSPLKLVECLESNKCALLVELVNGPPLARATEEFMKHQYSKQVATSMGSLFALDMILGNPDRLSCPSLGWRGNNNNSRWDTVGLRVVGIDHTLARRPPRMLKCTPNAVKEVTATIFDVDSTTTTATATTSPNNDNSAKSNKSEKKRDGGALVQDALSSVFGDIEMSDEERNVLGNQFRQGIRDVYKRSTVSSPSVLETLKQMESFLTVHLDVFFESLKMAVGVSEDCDFNSTRDLRNLQKKAAEDDSVRLSFKESQQILATAVDSYLASLPTQPHGARSFLGAGAECIAVNCYELRTRLRHIIPRFEAFSGVIKPLEMPIEEAVEGGGGGGGGA